MSNVKKYKVTLTITINDTVHAESEDEAIEWVEWKYQHGDYDGMLDVDVDAEEIE